MRVKEPKSVKTPAVPEVVFLPDELTFLKAAEKAWKGIKNDDTWAAWWKIGAALRIVRNGIMRQLRLNEPKGSSYNIAFGRYLNRHFPGLAVTKQASYILWLRSDPEREELCQRLRDEMTPQQRTRIADPNSMYKRVNAFMREREGDRKPRKPTPPAQRIRELEAEVASLHERLAGRDVDTVPVVRHWFEATNVQGIARLLSALDVAKAREVADELLSRDGEG